MAKAYRWDRGRRLFLMWMTLWMVSWIFEGGKGGRAHDHGGPASRQD